MKKAVLLVACFILAIGVGLGCESEKEQPEATVAPPPQKPSVAPVKEEPAHELKTLDEYREEAAREINEENAEEELEKLKAEIEADD